MVYIANFRTAKIKEGHELNWKESNDRICGRIRRKDVISEIIKQRLLLKIKYTIYKKKTPEY